MIGKFVRRVLLASAMLAVPVIGYAQEAVLTAQNLATELTHAEIAPEHLLVALVEQEGGRGMRLLIDPGAKLVRRIELVVPAKQLEEKAPLFLFLLG